MEKFVQVDEFVCDHLFGIGYHFEKFRSKEATRKKKITSDTYLPTHPLTRIHTTWQTNTTPNSCALITCEILATKNWPIITVHGKCISEFNMTWKSLNFRPELHKFLVVYQAQNFRKSSKYVDDRHFIFSADFLKEKLTINPLSLLTFIIVLFDGWLKEKKIIQGKFTHCTCISISNQY